MFGPLTRVSLSVCVPVLIDTFFGGISIFGGARGIRLRQLVAYCCHTSLVDTIWLWHHGECGNQNVDFMRTPLVLALPDCALSPTVSNGVAEICS